MPRIPIYQQQEIASGSFQPGSMPAQDLGLGNVGVGLQQAGRSLGQLSSYFIKVEEENAKVEAGNFLANSELEWKEKLIEYQNNAKPGAQGYTKTVAEDFDKWADESLKTVENARARKLLAENMSGLRKSVMGTAITYEASEGLSFRYNTTVDTIQKLGQVIMLDPNEANLGRIMSQGTLVIDSLEMPESKKEDLRDKLKTTLGQSGAKSMAENQPAVLLAQVEAARKRGDKDTSGNAYLDLLPATEWQRYIDAAKNNTDAIAVEANANAIWSELGPTSDIAAVNTDVMYKRIDEVMASNTPAERKAAKAFIDDLARTHNFSANERNVEMTAGVWDLVLKGVPLQQITRSKEFAALDGKSKVQLIDQINNRRKSDSKADGVGQFAAYLKLTENPERFAKMSDNDIISLAPYLGENLTKKALEKRQSLNDPANVQAATLDADTFNYLAEKLGLRPYDTKKSEKEKAELGRLKYAVEQAIDVEQQTSKRKLNPQEKEKVMQRVMDNKVMLDVLFTDPEKPVAIIAPDDLSKAYVVVNGMEVKLNSIPSQDRAMIIRQLRENGDPITEQAIAEVWVESNQQNKPKDKPKDKLKDIYAL
jgi:hypothetical protein